MISPENAERFSGLINDPHLFAERFLSIRSLDGEIIPFKFNCVQKQVQFLKGRLLAAGRPRRWLILKARRMGVTTMEMAYHFCACALRKNQEVLTLAHDNLNTEKIFRIATLFYQNLDPTLRPPRLTDRSKRDLNFYSLNSLYSIATAGSKAPSRGQTLNRVHWSEVAWSPGDDGQQENLLVGLTEAAGEHSVTLESTPNGIGNMFHSLCLDAQRKRGPWNLIFIPWFRDPRYTLPVSDEARRLITSTYTDAERDLVKNRGLTVEQIAWRRKKIDDLTTNGTSRLFPQEYPEDVESCFLSSGEHFFDIAKVQAIIQEGFAEPVERRDIPGEQEGTGGRVLIFKKPEENRQYIAGGDVAGGGPSGNESVLKVLDVEKCEEVALLHGRWRPEVFAHHCAALAHVYNNALLAIESNNHGHSTLNTLINDVGYPCLYHHMDYATGKPRKEPGWITDGKTRPIMINELRAAIESRWLICRDRMLLAQALTFKLDRDEEKYKAAPGCFDDDIMATAIAIQARKVPRRIDADFSLGPDLDLVKSRRFDPDDDPDDQ